MIDKLYNLFCPKIVTKSQYILNKKGEVRDFTYKEVLWVIRKNGAGKMYTDNWRIEEKLPDGTIKTYTNPMKFKEEAEGLELEEQLEDSEEWRRKRRTKEIGKMLNEHPKDENGEYLRCSSCEHELVSCSNGLCYACSNAKIAKGRGKSPKDIGPADTVEWLNQNPFKRMADDTRGYPGFGWGDGTKPILIPDDRVR